MRTTILILFVFISTGAMAQVQNIRGTVIDRNSRQPLANASLLVLDAGKTITALSDSSGKFILKNIPTGRIRVSCTYVGYQDYVSDNIILNSAKEPELIIEMEDAGKQQEAVVVKTTRNPKLPVNRYSLVSG